MKKIIIILSLLFAFNTTVSAQEAKTATEKEVANKVVISNDIAELENTITISEPLKNDFRTLMNMRSEAIQNAKSIEEKKSIYEKIGQKLFSALTTEQQNALKAKPELYKKLTVYSGN